MFCLIEYIDIFNPITNNEFSYLNTSYHQEYQHYDGIDHSSLFGGSISVTNKYVAIASCGFGIFILVMILIISYLYYYYYM